MIENNFSLPLDGGGRACLTAGRVEGEEVELISPSPSPC